MADIVQHHFLVGRELPRSGWCGPLLTGRRKRHRCARGLIANTKERKARAGTDRPEGDSGALGVLERRSRQHALMQDADDEDAAWLLAVEDHMAALLHAAQARPDIIAAPANRGRRGQAIAAFL